MSSNAYHVRLNERFGAHNYHPFPVAIASAKGVWLTTVNGQKILDGIAMYSAANQGHCHPRIVAALIEQAGKLAAIPRCILNDQTGDFFKLLAGTCGKDMVLPKNGGVEAVEVAIKVMRKWAYTVKGVPDNMAEIIVFGNEEHSNFHGRTITVIGFSCVSQYKDNFGPFTPGFRVVRYGNIDAVREAVNENTAGILIEPIMGEGGIIIPPDGFLKDLRKLCNEKKILFAADEIQVGLGRTGALFCCDHEDVVPDIYIVGKALGGGIFPVSAVVANEDVLGVIEQGDEGSTWGGNPLAARVAIEALRVTEEECLCERSAGMGDYIKRRLQVMNSPYVEEVRGRGLLIGIELKKEAGSARPFCEKLLKYGVFTKETHDRVIRFTPPLIISSNETEWALERIERVLTEPLNKFSMPVLKF